MDLFQLKSFVLFEYNLGSADFKIDRMEFEFIVNNQLFLIQTPTEKFILKFNESLNDFYGITDSLTKLEIISKVTHYLVENQLPVENIVSSKSGNFVIPYLQGSIRIFRFIEGRQYSKNEQSDLSSIVKFSKKLHSFPIEPLKNNVSNVETYLVAPYSLESTINKSEFIIDKLKFSANAECISFIPKLEEVIETARHYIEWNAQFKPSLLHCDLHPRNVIFDLNNLLHVIDLDYLRFGNPFVCLGLSLTRISFFGENQKGSDQILKNLEIFESEYNPVSGDKFILNLINGAIYIEIEKIFRNLYRYLYTGKYKKFADDVFSIHYNYFNILKNMKNQLRF